jgi:hypothetical protein
MSHRKADIQALLTRVNEDAEKIEREYNDSLHDRSIQPNLRIDIKNLFENLRSILDYLAHDVRERYCSGANSKERFYFPVLPDKATFDTQVDRWFPGLRGSCPDLVAFLESVQPYQHDMEWLGYFNRVNNENKHGNLIEQTRSEWVETKVTSVNGGRVSWMSGVTFSEGVSIMGVPIDPKTQLPVPHPTQKVERINWIDFRFSDIDVSALWLIKSSVSGVKTIVNNMNQWL